MNKAFPRRGEIWVVNFNPGRGNEQKGIRPALILQNDIGNQYGGTTIIAAITTTIRLYPVTVTLEKGEAGLKQRSTVNLAQILTTDKERLMKKLGYLSPPRMIEVEKALKISLELEKL